MENSYRSKSWHIVLEEYDKLNDKHITEDDINNYLKDEMRFVFYAFIKHDSDVDSSNNKEHNHFHIIIICNTSYSKNTIISSFASGLFINRDIVSVRKMKNVVLSVQYLIHMNDKEKYQYDLMDVWSNDINELHSIIFESASQYELDIEYLIELVKSCDFITDVYRILGLDKSKKYRSLLKDMWNEEHPYGY